MSFDSSEAGLLRAEIAALEQLLEIQERTVSEQTDRLARQSAELLRSNHALEQFAYIISHDLQEPLRMVAAYTELLRETFEGKIDETADKYIGFASGGARRMQELINALLDYSRVTTRNQELGRVSLDEVVGEALENLRLAIEESGASIARQSLPDVLGDRYQLLRLVQNLVANALKFREAGKPIEIAIRGEREGASVRLDVQDNGIGIEARHHARIFEIFRRIHPKRFPGTGIGLAICQRIAERHGGTIRVHSTLGQGSTFCITLPLIKEEP